MKLLLAILFIFSLHNSFAQSNFEWVEKGFSSFKVYHSKQRFPKKFLQYIGRSKKEIANHRKKWSPGCTNPKRNQLIWIAKDNDGNCIVSLSSGGKAIYNQIYFFDINTLECIEILSPHWTKPYTLQEAFEAYENEPDKEIH